MKTKWIALIIIALVVGVVAVVALETYTFPQTATITKVNGDVALWDEELGDAGEWVTLPDGYTFDWGSVEPSDIWRHEVKITNVGTAKFTVSFETTINQYVDWTQTWTLKEIDADPVMEPLDENVYILTLGVPSTVEPGTYSWTTTISFDEYT